MAPDIWHNLALLGVAACLVSTAFAVRSARSIYDRIWAAIFLFLALILLGV